MNEHAMEFREQRFFTITYFLADDTIQVEEQCDPNSGRKGFFTTFLARQKLPKAYQVSTVSKIGNQEIDANILRWEELKVGASLKIMSVNFFVYDADDATRRFYLEQNQPLGAAEEVSWKNRSKSRKLELARSRKLEEIDPQKEVHAEYDGCVLMWTCHHLVEQRKLVKVTPVKRCPIQGSPLLSLRR